MVYLFGTRHQFAINKWYGRFARESEDDVFARGTFIEQLRPHLGYRIEQFGSNVRGFRFAHPTYEEAFVESAKKDIDLLAIARRATEHMALEDNEQYAKSIFRNVKKQPEFASMLLTNVVEAVGRSDDASAKLDLAQRLVGAYDTTGESTFLFQISKLTSLTELLKSINNTKTCRNIARGLQVAINLARLAGHEAISLNVQIDWKNLLNVLVSSSSTHSILDVLQRTREIRPDLLHEFLSRKSDLSIARLLMRSPPTVHARFLSLAEDPRLPHIVEIATEWRVTVLLVP
jgi:hypothetical protein